MRTRDEESSSRRSDRAVLRVFLLAAILEGTRATPKGAACAVRGLIFRLVLDGELGDAVHQGILELVGLGGEGLNVGKELVLGELLILTGYSEV